MTKLRVLGDKAFSKLAALLHQELPAPLTERGLRAVLHLFLHYIIYHLRLEAIAIRLEAIASIHQKATNTQDTTCNCPWRPGPGLGKVNHKIEEADHAAACLHSLDKIALKESEDNNCVSGKTSHTEAIQRTFCLPQAIRLKEKVVKC